MNFQGLLKGEKFHKTTHNIYLENYRKRYIVSQILRIILII